MATSKYQHFWIKNKLKLTKHKMLLYNSFMKYCDNLLPLNIAIKCVAERLCEFLDICVYTTLVPS